jgi:hypothetical protein
MSELKWDSERIRKHLRAICGLFDPQLIKNGLDPNRMRNMFYQFFTREYKKLKPSSILTKVLYPIEGEYKEYVVYNLQKRKCIHIDGWTDDNIEVYYLFVGEKLNGDLVTRNVTKSYTDMIGANQEITDSLTSWDIGCEEKANFVNITLDYHHMIVDICDTWGYEKVLAHMRSMEG